MVPQKGGQGQLFAFSALEGDAFFTDDFTGILSGDKIGVIFHSLCRRTLYFGDMNNLIAPKLKCVTSDMIILETLIGTLSKISGNQRLRVENYACV